MQRYFFDVSDDTFIKDETGSEADDMASVRSKAVEVATGAMEAEAATGGNSDAVKVLVRDETGRRVLTVQPLSPERRS